MAKKYFDNMPSIDKKALQESLEIKDFIKYFGGINVGSGIVDGSNNPTFQNAIEDSILMDGDQCDCWYHDLSTVNHNFMYAYATNAKCDNWVVGNAGQPLNATNPDLVDTNGKTVLYPHVFKVGITYYLIGVFNQEEAAPGGVPTGDIYMWSSPDKITWTKLNAGNPVLSRSETASDWNHHLFNPAVVEVGGILHLLIEGFDSNLLDSQTGYSSTTLELLNFNTNLSATGVLPNFYKRRYPDNYPLRDTGNAHLISIPDRNALLAVYGDYSGDKWMIKAASALLSSDLKLPESWVSCEGFGISAFSETSQNGIHLTDPTMVFTDSINKDFKCMLIYNYNQSDRYQAYGQATLNEFYDKITSPISENVSKERKYIGDEIEADIIKLGHKGLVKAYTDKTNSFIIETGERPYATKKRGYCGNGEVYAIDSETNTLKVVHTLTARTTGTPSNGLGSALAFATESIYQSAIGSGYKIVTSQIESVMSNMTDIHSTLFFKTVISNILASRFGVDSSGRFIILNVPEYADNAAAITAGLSVGAVYRTSDTLKIVH